MSQPTHDSFDYDALHADVVSAVRAARKIAVRFSAGEFRQAGSLYADDDISPRITLVHIYNEIPESRGHIQNLLEALSPKIPTTAHGDLIRACCTELLYCFGLCEVETSAHGAHTKQIFFNGYEPDANMRDYVHSLIHERTKPKHERRSQRAIAADLFRISMDSFKGSDAEKLYNAFRGCQHRRQIQLDDGATA